MYNITTITKMEELDKGSILIKLIDITIKNSGLVLVLFRASDLI